MADCVTSERLKDYSSLSELGIFKIVAAEVRRLLQPAFEYGAGIRVVTGDDQFRLKLGVRPSSDGLNFSATTADTEHICKGEG